MIRRLATVSIFCLSVMAQAPRHIVPPPAAMVVDGVPAIPDSPTVRRKIGLYSVSNEATLMDWSRKDRTIADQDGLHQNEFSPDL